MGMIFRSNKLDAYIWAGGGQRSSDARACRQVPMR